jgi:hypothetical protein
MIAYLPPKTLSKMPHKSPKKEEKSTPPSISPLEGIRLLNLQQQKAEKLLSSRPLDSAYYSAWRNTTREILIKAFGSDSANIKSFTSIGSSGAIVMNAGEAYYENERAENLSKKLIMLTSMIEQLEIETQLSPQEAPVNVWHIIETLCCRFYLVARQLRERHDNRPTLEVENEYDVQDLFHALLHIYFDDIRPEESTPSYAGKTSRMDFLLKEHSIVIEIKKTRPGLGAREVGSQLIEDIARYQTHPHCTTLICFVYDPEGRVANPRGLEADLTKQHGELHTKVFIFPRN